jgi:hypothetical protein
VAQAFAHFLDQETKDISCCSIHVRTSPNPSC